MWVRSFVYTDWYWTNYEVNSYICIIQKSPVLDIRKICTSINLLFVHTENKMFYPLFQMSNADKDIYFITQTQIFVLSASHPHKLKHAPMFRAHFSCSAHIISTAHETLPVVSCFFLFFYLGTFVLPYFSVILQPFDTAAFRCFVNLLLLAHNFLSWIILFYPIVFLQPPHSISHGFS